jgi:RHS repeat-associated protein
VLLELSDYLGSSSAVIDKESGELVERNTYQAYGSPESDYRPDRWGAFREDYRFTGKEEDIEVGLQYFEKRYYAPSLGRWMSADPLAVHAPGEADLNVYAYVSGKVLATTDPLGLEEPGYARRAGESYEDCYKREYSGWLMLGAGDSPVANRAWIREQTEEACDPNNDPHDNYRATALGAAVGVAPYVCAWAPGVCGKGFFVLGMSGARNHDEAFKAGAMGYLGGRAAQWVFRSVGRAWSSFFPAGPTAAERAAAFLSNTDDAANYIIIATKAPTVSNPFGHSVVGVKLAKEEAVLIHQVGGTGKFLEPVRGGYPTEIDLKPMMAARLEGYTVMRLELPREQAKAAMAEVHRKLFTQGEMAGGAGPYDIFKNSCTTNCFSVIKAAGLELFSVVRTPAQLAQEARSLGFKAVE